MEIVQKSKGTSATSATASTATASKGGLVSTGGAGMPMPKTSFLELCQQRRFNELQCILEQAAEYDMDGWLFLDAQSFFGGVSSGVSPMAGSGGSVVSSPGGFSGFASIGSPSPSKSMKLFKRSKRGLKNTHSLHLFRGESPLHVLLQYRPTLPVVEELLKVLACSSNNSGAAVTTPTASSVPEDALDMQGQTPLHVAVANGCDVEIVRLLLSGVSAVMPAVAKDNWGRHALHRACGAASYVQPRRVASSSPGSIVGDSKSVMSTRTAHRKKSHMRSDRSVSSNSVITTLSTQSAAVNSAFNSVENMLAVIELLIKSYPEALVLADNDKKTPLDLAREARAAMVIQQLVQKKTQEVRSKQMNRGNSKLSKKKSGRNLKASTSDEADDDSFNDNTLVRALNENTIECDDQAVDELYDDVSSIGSGGVSLFFAKPKANFSSPYQPGKALDNIKEGTSNTTPYDVSKSPHRHKQRKLIDTLLRDNNEIAEANKQAAQIGVEFTMSETTEEVVVEEEEKPTAPPQEFTPSQFLHKASKDARVPMTLEDALSPNAAKVFGSC